LDKYVREQNLSWEDAKQLAYTTWWEHHESCPKAAFHKIKDAWTPDVRKYVAFFVGVQNLNAWYDTAWDCAAKQENYNPKSGEAMASISQTHRAKLVVGGISRDDWGQMLDGKFQVSHLSGISDDGNPLNHILEPLVHNKL
jgi:hypothetical protein